MSTLCGYTGICDLVSPNPLEPLLEDGGSLPASKRVSGTQARLWIEGVWVPRSLQHRRLGPVLLEFPKWRLTYWQRISTFREPVASLNLQYVLVYRCSHVQNGGLTQMSLLFPNTVTFSGYTPKHIASSPLLLYNQIQTHTHWSMYCNWLLPSNFVSRASLWVEERRTLTYWNWFLSLSLCE